ncbi:type I methionyl aminopeptidase [Candidatus Kaiserbacteria bacterium RIFCSPLOWO2_01_FULL_53_17]|uniref:Methionine aminopeptidase n=1 Tax=Candidatus Kaiserbacteria bacterium RIFCSPLOWO2_01_FULL_53_17 TaxID=1798511 RepID=A0A1F6EHK8_9BACT|nr:MAG: type I methionyl aminopeptidase [Candidatus Kaiserbacteria bacterium RIFCSPLOWO2_01_FULL_53_17]
MVAKTKKEIEALRESGRRLASHLQELSKMVKPGVTPKEIDVKARELLKADGDQPAFLGYGSGKNGDKFPSVICVSSNDTIVHCPASGVSSTRQFEEGDVVSLDFGVKHKGFYTDHAVTIITGKKHDPKDEEMVKAAYEAVEAGIAQARVGNTTGDIGEAVERIANKYGLGFPRNLCGHGVGKKIHEEPHVPNFRDPRHDVPLEEGLVIAIEPMFTRGSGDLFIDKDNFSYRTKDGSRTAHVEHTVMVTKQGPEILTKV